MIVSCGPAEVLEDAGHQVDAQQLEDAGHQVDAQQLEDAGHQVDAGRPCSGTNPCPWGFVCVGDPDDAGQVLTAHCEAVP